MAKVGFLFFILVNCAWGLPQKPLVPMLDGRIVGGSSVNIESYPYQVSLLFYGSHLCGGSLISQSIVLSAAHCTTGRAVSAFAVRAGSSIRNSGGTVAVVARITNHIGYNSDTVDYDICLLHLASSFGLSSSIGVVSLATSAPSAGTLAVVTGWGTTSEEGSAATQLQAVTVPIISISDCRAAYGSSAITDRMLCAGLLGVGGRDSCQGDSGGPLVANGEQVGIVSWGYGCARPEFPGVYASVPALRSWISSNSGV